MTLTRFAPDTALYPTLPEDVLLPPLYTPRTPAQDEQQWRAYADVLNLIPLRAKLPTLGGWAILPDFAAVLARHIRDHAPQTILELGGGVSTLIAAYGLEQQSSGRVVSVDHDAEFARLTRERVEQHGLSAWVEFIHAPLVSLTLDDARYAWYNLNQTALPATVDLLVVDGPPQQDQPQGQMRYPALPVLLEHVAPGGYILLDDAARLDEQTVVYRWLQQFATRLTVAATLPLEKGAVLLRKVP